MVTDHDPTEIIEGVIVDDTEPADHLAANMLESTTEYDWNPARDGYHLPDHLRDELRTWAQRFIEWDRAHPHRAPFTVTQIPDE